MAGVHNASRIILRFLAIAFCTGIFVAILLLLRASPAPSSVPRTGHFSSHTLPWDASTCLAIIRVLQGVLTLVSFNCAVGTMEILQWCLVSRGQARRYSTFLILSPATGLLALLRILVSRRVLLEDRLWALLKTTVFASIYISAFVLFYKTSTSSSYEELGLSSYSVTAGIGAFDRTYVPSFFDWLISNYTSNATPKPLPYKYQAIVYDLVVNPMYSSLLTPSASGWPNTTRESYLLSGGVLMAYPPVPSSNPAYSFIRIEQLPSIQLDFVSVEHNSFHPSDCSAFGKDNLTFKVQLCLQNTTEVGSLVAGLYVCNSTEETQCYASNTRKSIIAKLSAVRRYATIVAASSNMSIIDTSDLTPPTSHPPIDLEAYRKGVEWLLNFTDTGIPSPSSISQHFWNYGEQLSGSAKAAADLRWTFQGLLAFPFWLFNPNNFGNILLPNSTTTNTILPDEFHRNATIVAEFERVYFEDDTAILFGVAQGFVILFVWVVLFWAWLSGALRYVPTMSSFTVFDSAFKAQTNMRFSRQEVFYTKDQEILDMAKSARVLVHELYDLSEGSGQGRLVEVHEVPGTDKNPAAIGIQEMQA